jgi:hypothetical protein
LPEKWNIGRVPQDKEGIIKKNESNQNVIIFGYNFADLPGIKPGFFILFRRQSPVFNLVPEPCLSSHGSATGII